ncbi:siderophore ABC transporter substrate-binding protein [Marinobacter sp. 1_MG-2023]|uniref:siderophore ABC transporter substrate-binding protein n=1 Tax=Marinobacter sp. 1_MG-2023 TaxID=3062627 RepID=UPI0026E290B2|nr:siderophore ABC transporter substrate-binding protein [Marinobacter sp. 1_MG-2023]MDO6823567.1 siderophore ABC transporter substrate-binding protein [Marinobacter sp. 1_MG-2023]
MRLSLFSIFRTISFFSLLLIGAIAPAYANALLTIEHAKGETQIPKLPKTVAVLDWSTLDTMAALGVEAQGIPRSNIMPPMLDQYDDARFVQIGSLFEPDYEALQNLKPDLIILGRRASSQYEKVAEYGPTLDLTPDPKDMLGSVVRNTEILGQIFDREEQAAELTAKLKASVKQLQTLAAKQGSGLTLLTSGGKMRAFGIGTRFGMIHDVFGVTPAVADLKVGRHGQAVSYEFLLEANPDWLFVMDRDAAIGREGVAAKQMMDNELVQATEAGAKGQIVYLEPVSWYLLDNSGLRVLQSNVDRLLEVFSN